MKKIITISLTFILLLTLFIVPNSFISSATEIEDTNIADCVLLCVGSNERERNLAWYSTISDAGEVRIAPANQVIGGVFPAVYTKFTATSVAASLKEGWYAKKATINNLSENTQYAYVIAVNDSVSKIRYFSTSSFSDFEFVFTGDPQFATAEWAVEWSDTLRKAMNNTKSQFVVSSGDQIETATSEEEYSNFIVDEMSQIAFAPSAGFPHDAPSSAYSDHYNLPNLSDKYAKNETTSNYWYMYNNTLFMHLNTSADSRLTDEHKLFIEETISANPTAKWKIVIFHNSLFSTGNHYNDWARGNLLALTPTFTEQGIDIVLSGHDHLYVRTHIMNENEVADDKVVNNTASNPSGPIYICGSSSTGSKFYKSVITADFVALESTVRRKSFVKFSITDDSLTLNSYYLDTMERFDTFTIVKKTLPGDVDGNGSVDTVDLASLKLILAGIE